MILGRALHEYHIVVVSEGLGVGGGHLSPVIDACLLVFEVVFIAHQDYRQFIVGVGFCFGQPLAEVVEGLFVGDVVH